MAEVHAFFDRDVFLKLACCDLWDDTISAFAVTHPYRLASTSSMRSASKALNRMGVSGEQIETIMGRLETMIANTKVLPEEWANGADNIELLNQLNDTTAIDTGEALLTVAVFSCPHEKRLVTGDKRYVSALSEEFPAEYKALLPSLVSFERCLLNCVEIYGFEYVRNKVAAARTCDGTLKIALSAGMDTEESHFTEALRSFDLPLVN